MTFYSEYQESIMEIQENQSSIDIVIQHHINNFMCHLCNRKMLVDLKHADLICPGCWQVIPIDNYSIFTLLEFLRNPTEKRHKMKLPCPNCYSEKICKYGKRENKYTGLTNKYACLTCGRIFSSRTGTPFLGMRYNKDQILQAVKFVMLGISLRDTEKFLLRKFPFKVDHMTISNWSKNPNLVGLIVKKNFSKIRRAVKEYNEIKKYNYTRRAYMNGIGKNHEKIELKEEPKLII